MEKTHKKLIINRKKFSTFASVVHIGEQIKEIFERSGLRTDAVLKAMNIGKRTLYDDFLKPSLASDRIKAYSQLFNYNFFDILSKDAGFDPNKSEVNEPETEYKKPNPMKITMTIELLNPEMEQKLLQPEVRQKILDCLKISK